MRAETFDYDRPLQTVTARCHVEQRYALARLGASESIVTVSDARALALSDALSSTYCEFDVLVLGAVNVRSTNAFATIART